MRAELSRHERTVEAFPQVKPIHVYLALLRFFLPAIVIVTLLCATYYLCFVSLVIELPAAAYGCTLTGAANPRQ